jgi:hypothetical protein
VPKDVWLTYPSLLDLPQPRLRAYQPETVIAEKLHAMVVLDRINSRLRDFFDVYTMAVSEEFDGEVLASALAATFERRRTELPQDTPFALTDAFAEVEGRRRQWHRFLAKDNLTTVPNELVEVIRLLNHFLVPVINSIRQSEAFNRTWPPGGRWK